MIGFILSLLVLISSIELNYGQLSARTSALYYTYADPYLEVKNSNYAFRFQFNIWQFGTNWIGNNADQSLLTARAYIATDKGYLSCAKYNTTLPDGTSWNNTVIFAFRGTCLAQQKLAYAQAAGALGIIQVACNPGAPTFCPNDRRTGVAYASQGTLAEFKIPMASADWDIAGQLINLIAANPNINLTAYIPATGPLVDPNELKALQALSKITFVTDLSLNNYWTIPIQNWNGTDPCVGPRISQITCLNGHIVKIHASHSPLLINSSLPIELNYLTQLETIVLATVTFNGGLPELTNCTNLRMLSITKASGKLTNLMTTVEYFPNLEVFDLDQTTIKTLPTGFEKLNKLAIFWVYSNSITSIPTLNSSKLFYYDISYNNVSDTFDKVPPNQNIQYINIAGNNIRSTNISTRFDYTSLISIDLSNNAITGPLPFFRSCSNLTFINLANNAFSGSIPSSWNVANLQYIDVSKNKLQGPFDLRYTSVTDFDISNNLINPMGNPWNLSDWSSIFKSAFPPTIVNINLSNNLIAGKWPGAQYWGVLNMLGTLNLAYNKITQIPSDIGSGKGFVNLDLSYNDINTDILNSLLLLPTMKSLSLQGNPRLIATTKSLPTWARIGNTFLKNSINDSFSCPQIVPAAGYTLTLNIDPAYYYWKNCVCDRGYYGNAPACSNIPIYINTNNSVVKTYKDSDYGNSRLSVGMDSTWIIINNLEATSTIITFQINILPEFYNINPEFPDFPNQISVESSCPRGINFNPILNKCSCFANQVFNVDSQKCENSDITQTSTNNFFIDSSQSVVSSASYQVINKFATFNFKSKKISGNHFSFNFTISNDCPIGYQYFSNIVNNKFISSKCEKVYYVNTGIQSAVYVVSSLFSVILIALTFIIVKKRNSLIIKSSSYPFCLCMIVFMTILSASGIFYALTPLQTSAVCHLRPWFTAFPLTAILSALLVKADRIRKIFGAKELVVQAITNAELARTMCMMLSLQIAILLWHTFTDNSGSISALGSGKTANLLVFSCKDASTSWMGVQFAYISVFLFAGVVEAWGVRKVPSAFNEGPHIASTLLSLIVLLIILIPVQFMVTDNPDALIVIRGIGQTLVSVVMAFFLFGPKLYYIFEGKENDKSMSSIGSSKSSSSFSSSSTTSSQSQ